MKIIDLLNKIAKGEEVPKKFEFANEIFTNNGIYISDEDGDSIFESLFSDFSNLNDEIEIIEEKPTKKEDKDIERFCFSVYETIALGEIENKINELIDEINRLKRGE